MVTIGRADSQRVWLTDPIGRMLALAAASHGRAVAVLLVVLLLAVVPGFFTIPPIDRDETRFAQATKQMVETGDFIDIRYQDQVRYKKPVGIYWLQAGAVMAGEALGIPSARTRIWLYRLPSLIGAAGAVLLTYWTALAFVPRRYALLAGLILAASILLVVEARLAKTDAALLFAVVATMGALARAYLGRVAPDGGRGAGGTGGGLSSLGLPLIFWTALAAGVLLKGPVIVLVAGLTVVTLVIYDRSARFLLALRPEIGIPWFILLVLPWFLAIVGRAGESFFAESVGRDMLPKLVTGQEGHGAPPGYYLLLFWVTFWPAAPLALMAAPDVFADRRERPVRFLLAWLVPSWIVFELVMTKLPHYVLPLYPAIAILIARTIRDGALSGSPWLKRSTLWWPLVPILVPIAGIVALGVMRHQLGLLAWPFGAAAMIFGFMAWRYYDADGAEKSLVRAVAAAVLVMIAFVGIIAPSLRPLFPSATIARVLPMDDCDYRIIAAAGYHEPSLVFLLGTSIKLTDGAGAAELLRGGYCRFALVESREQRAFAQRAEAIGLRYALGPRVEGINTNSGRAVSIAIYRAGKAP
jgi:4-amino-4-deoxy-L-arabinose transferase-like glycosyltransferase